MARISNISGRGALALLGGYGVAAAWAGALARVLPGSRIDATVTATMAAFVIYAAVAIVIFALERMRDAALVVSALCAVGALLWWAAS